MAKSQIDELTDETISKGGILAKLYFDMESEKKEDLQPIMTDLINNRLLKAVGVVYCVGVIEEPIKVDKNYSTNATVTGLFKDIGSLINVSFNFAPAGLRYSSQKGKLGLSLMNCSQYFLILPRFPSIIRNTY